MNKNTTIALILFFASCGLLATSYFIFKKQPKTAYVDNIELFNGFNFKKERLAEYERVKKQYQNALDTLKMNHMSIKAALDGNPGNQDLQKRLAYSYEYYQQMDYTLGSKLDSIDGAFNNQVWTKLNTYVTEYGKDNGYDMIIGASGTGTLMYGSDSYNITQDVLEYANKKYEGNE